MTITLTNDAAVDTRIVRLQGGGLRYLDAQPRTQVVTRTYRDADAAQHWRVTEGSAGVCTIQQVSTGRFLDAYAIEKLDFLVVTRPLRDSDTQRWRIEDFGGGFAIIQQVSSGRFLEATLDGNFAVVTRPAGNSEQTWRIRAP
jgi:Ricin-type beta-trefoil lectin domain-like